MKQATGVESLTEFAWEEALDTVKSCTISATLQLIQFKVDDT